MSLFRHLETIQKIISEILPVRVNNLILLLLFLLNSCALLQKDEVKFPLERESRISIAKQYLSSICLEGEGRVEIFEGKKHYQASFESKWDLQEKEWKSAFYVPLYGEESFFVNYGNKVQKASGSLWEKSKNNLETTKFVNVFRDFLNLIYVGQTEKNQFQNCSLSEKKSSSDIIKMQCFNMKKEFDVNLFPDQSLEITSKIDQQLSFFVVGTHYNQEEKYYDQISFDLLNLKNKNSYWSMKILLSKCTKLSNYYN